MKLLEYIRVNKYKIFKTILTYITFAGLGGTNTLVGSSLLDLQIRVQRSFDATSRLVQARSIGYVIGASSCGFLGERINNYLALSLADLVAGLFLIIAPWFKILEVIITCIVASGFAQGILDIYCNVIILRIWGVKGINWLQVLHMSFGFGALITPIFTRPFLLPNTGESSDSELINATSTFTGNETISSSNNYIGGYSPDEVKVQYSFLILGGILVIVSIPIFFCYLYERKLGTEQGNEEDKKTDAHEGETGKIKKFIATFMVAILANLTFGSEAAIGNLCTAFAVKADLKMEKQTAVLLATVYWTTFSFYRLIFIPLTLLIKESRLFYFNLLIILAGVVALVPNAASKAIFAWIAFVLLGIGYSPCFSISFASLEKYFHMSNSITSFILVCGTLGETVHTAVLSIYIDRQPIIFVYYIGVMSLVYVAVSVILPYYLRKMCSKRVENSIGNKRNLEMEKY
ncbi:sodium-dependent glucose transporter 1C-like [Tetranychus urticae]|uniref:Major facilitator superfamily (MFS) profile domain-containing protein n=1 Tax=Tetranychus urticae TaxID=32264 RepID=T1JTX4_TETUR|nr:sodium-dependent glucose transporter 1C-like [Tetranychus urticae]